LGGGLICFGNYTGICARMKEKNLSVSTFGGG
jgi:hypothetical protein